MSSDNDNSDDCRVGYKSPPQHTRFKKGRSGNPEGRKKGARGVRKLLSNVLDSKIEITENGVRRKVPKREAMFMALAAKAMKGDARAASLMINYIKEHEPDEEDGPLVVVLKETVDPRMTDEEWNKKYGSGTILDIPRKDLGRMTGEQLEILITMHKGNLNFTGSKYETVKSKKINEVPRKKRL